MQPNFQQNPKLKKRIRYSLNENDTFWEQTTPHQPQPQPQQTKKFDFLKLNTITLPNRHWAVSQHFLS
jgi:hypothetical protein